MYNLDFEWSVMRPVSFIVISTFALTLAPSLLGQGPPPGGGFPLPTSGQTGGFVTVAANTTFVVRQSALVFSSLTLEDGATVSVLPGIQEVQITCEKLTLRGKSTFDLTPYIDYVEGNPANSQPAKPPTPRQAQPSTNNPQGKGQEVNGQAGTKGKRGNDGLPGIRLVLNIAKLDASQGSLWIKNDGGGGFPGGDGGDGAKGSSGPHNGIVNADGGNGGDGGDGGDGGRGGPSGRVRVTVAGDTVMPTHPGTAAPSARPTQANSPGVIVIYGSPGSSGAPGNGGNGGAGGEGHKGEGFSSDSKTGSPGRAGAKGKLSSPLTN